MEWTTIQLVIITWWIFEGSGFTTSVSKTIWNVFKTAPYRGWQVPKPFSCSSCMVFWVITAHWFSQGLVLALFIASISALSVPLLGLIWYWFNKLIYILKK